MAWLRFRQVLSWFPLAVVLNDCVGLKPVHGYSMQPTLNENLGAGRDLVAVDRASFRFGSGEIRRGDVVVVRNPSKPDHALVKRVLAREGDWIRAFATGEICRVPTGHCWIEGDNPHRSTDSNTFGPVSEGLVDGRVFAVVWPPSRCRLLAREATNPTLGDRLVKTRS